MKVLRPIVWIVILALAPPSWAAGSMGGGGASSDPTSAAPAKSPEQIARTSYRAGVKHKKKAWKHEARAAETADEKKKQKFLTRARKEYERAVGQQKRALGAVNDMHEAANELGYALRKTGHYKDAIGAYNWALKLKPDFAEAKEYKGEALLALGQLDATKTIYMDLFRTDLEHAAMLLTAMENWVAAQTSAADEKIRAFAEWVAERKMAAQVTDAAREQSGRAW